MGRHHVRVYSHIPECELVALVDADPSSKTLADKYGIAYFANHEQMLKEIIPDAVSVVVPTPYHLLIASTCLKAGAHVLVEKPIAASVTEANELMDIARASDKILTVGHIERFNPAVRHLRELIDSGRLGKISTVTSRRVGGFPLREPKTDVVVDLAIHDIDIIAFLLGEPPRLLAAHGSQTFHSHQIDSAELLIQYGNAAGLIQTNWVTPVKVRQIAVTGSKGYVELNYLTQAMTLYEHTAVRSQDNFENFIAELGTPRVQQVDIAFREPLQAELESFVRACQTGDLEKVVSSVEATQALMVALDAVENINHGGEYDPQVCRR